MISETGAPPRSRAAQEAGDDALLAALVEGDGHFRVGAWSFAGADDALAERGVHDAVAGLERRGAGRLLELVLHRGLATGFRPRRAEDGGGMLGGRPAVEPIGVVELDHRLPLERARVAADAGR